MLQLLSIKNYVLIESLKWEPGQGFNIITGETGAGKSILLDALGLLLGNRADSKVLYHQDQKCIIEGVFHLEASYFKDWFIEQDLDFDPQTILRREISSLGKSRAFINDTPVTLEIIKQLAEQLIDIHSQHETLLLGLQEFQIKLLDAYANTIEEYKEYKTSYKKYRLLVKQLDEARILAAQGEKEKDFNSFLLQELNDAQIQIQEEIRLEETLKELENAEFLQEKLGQSHDILNSDEGVVQRMKEVVKLLQAAHAFSPKIQPVLKRIEEAWIELKDVQQELDHIAEQVLVDGALLQQTQDRLSQIYTLFKKHQVKTTNELVSIQNQISDSLSSMLQLDDKLSNLEIEVEQAKNKVAHQAALLSQKRRAITPELTEKMVSLLQNLGMPNAAMVIDFEQTEPSVYGIDKVNIRFSSNKGMEPQGLKQAASGGEFSRLMLVVKCILAEKVYLPTLIFDEIDTGVSGEIALKMAQMMTAISHKHQVITISHLPQVAAAGNQHYFVYKDSEGHKTTTRLKQLNQSEREQEIAQMIAGSKVSDTALQSARELLNTK
jgi:DNA repair protein RecN (Recombination protein N)